MGGRFQQIFKFRVAIMSSDANVARLRAHQQNIERYERLLKTKLTELEVKFLQKRLWEERFWMAMLTKGSDLPAVRSGAPKLPSNGARNRPFGLQ